MSMADNLRKAGKTILLSGGLVFLTLDFGGSLQAVYAQKSGDKTAAVVVKPLKKNSKAAGGLSKSSGSKGTVSKSDAGSEDAERQPKQPPARVEVRAGDNPKLLTLVVGQVTTIKLNEPSLQIEGDRIGLVISESNENSVNHNVYLIPTQAGIRRNLVIETASGKIEFELQSIAVENGKTAVFTREVTVKTAVEEKRQASLAGEIAELRENLAARELEAAAAADRISAAVRTAQNAELKIQTEMMFAMAKAKKGKTQTDGTKEWQVSEIYAARTSDANRSMNLFEIEYRGKIPGKFLEVKADGGSQIYWQTENRMTEGGVLLRRGDKIRIAVIDFAGQGTSRSLMFVTETGVVKF